ncbi:MAG: radical SAM protein [Candidatus Aenigmarchaeota archaeon]|nr:radical SAM protein [Candidatus Aenigmarchaeota archaeon]
MTSLKVKEVQCKSALSPCGLPEFAYSINPYTGCAHGCVYCYARFMCRYGGHAGEEWGSFVDVKTNSPQIARKDLTKNKPGRIFLSSVTDCYQPLENKYQLTQKILGAIKDYGYPVCIQTKSSLVQRDLKIISGVKSCDFGMTVCFEDDKTRQSMEPNASPIDDRLKTLKTFSEVGVKTFAFFGPVMPGISDKNLPELFSKFADSEVKEVIVDRLNIKCGNLQPILKAIKEHYPELLGKYQELFVGGGDRAYYSRLKPEIERIAKENGLAVDWCF